MAESGLSIGIDVGGTFTDFVCLDPRTGRWRTAKLATTPADRAGAMLAGLSALEADPAAIDSLVHGTTAGTNAVLERKGAVCGLITTAGFRDVLDLGRRTRPHAYGLHGEFEPLIPREFRLEVDERMDAQGRVVRPLDAAGVDAAVDRLRALGADSVVIHFLHAYANPAHERRCAERVRARWPNGHVVAGHEVVAEIREFERGSTAAIHGLIRPVVTGYTARVADRLAAAGFQRPLMVMQGNGGMMEAGVVGANAAHTVMSGPAAGVLAAAEIARAAGVANLVTGDMGGTSYDVALVVDGQPVVTAETDLAYGVPLRIPMIDIHTIGAGGGSIARLDSGGMLQVGPDSAGADPGPVAYAQGGTQPTLTDANLLLGRIDPAALAGRDGPVPMDRVERALHEAVGRPLGLGAAAAAEAVLAVAVDALAGAIRLISVEQGHDPRDFALMPFGGAGPLHAVAIARELGIPRVLVPRYPGLTSALGCILADVRHDYVQTLNRPLAELDAATVGRVSADQAEAGRALLARERIEVQAVEVRHEADLLYQGQSHVIRLALPADGFDADRVAAALDRHYQERFGITLPGMVPVLANLRTTVIGRRAKPDLATLADADDLAAESGGPARRRVRFGGRWRDTPVHDRAALAPGSRIDGPAIVAQPDTTVAIDPGARAEVDRLGNLDIAVGVDPDAGASAGEDPA